MAHNILTNVNFNNNEIQNVKVQNLAVAPQNPQEGQIYYNTVDKAFYVWNGTEWKNTIQEVQQGRDFTQDIESAKREASDKSYSLEQRLLFLEGNNVNYNEKLAEVLRAQDPTINGLVKTIATLSEDEKRQIVEPVKTELTDKITAVKDELLGGASEDLNTLKELGDAVNKAGDIAKLVEKLPKKEKFDLTNESSGIYTLTHNLNTQDVVVSVYNPNKEQTLPDVQIVDVNTVKITVNQTVNMTGYKVVIVG